MFPMHTNIYQMQAKIALLELLEKSVTFRVFVCLLAFVAAAVLQAYMYGFLQTLINVHMILHPLRRRKAA